MPNLVDTNAFPAKMMTRQFRALKDYISSKNIEADLRRAVENNRFRRCATYCRNEIEKWLTNGWNTENILMMSKYLFDDPANSFAIQWAFPQAYYSCYCIILGFFKTAGFTEDRHSTVIKKIGCLIKEGKYPDFLSFYANGGMYQISQSGVSRSSVRSTVEYIPGDKDSMQTQISQFLNATREIDLKTKKEDVKRHTKQDKRKKSFNREDWEIVSDRLGPTNILSLLYRKRIKFNYDSIASVFSGDLDAHAIYESLQFLVGKINLIHEAYIYKILGGTEYNTIIQSRDRPEFVNGRLKIILQF